MTIRLRLTLLYSAILALVLIAFSLGVYTVQSQSLITFMERSLAPRAERLVEARQRYLRGDESPQPQFPERERPFSTLSILQVRDLRGEITQLPGSESGIVLPLTRAGLQAVRSGERWVEIASVEDERYLVRSMPVIVEGEISEIAQIGGSLAQQDQYLGALRNNLLIASGIATAAAFGLGWVLAGMALRPIHRITQTAQAIGAQRDFGRRVRYTGPRDELGRLATTFNAMLAELQEAYRQVEGSLEMLRDFVADVSHELRTPLTTIRGNLALLRNRPVPAEERDDILADTVDETERLIRLVSDLLTLARAEAGRQFQAESVPIKPLIEEVCRKARLLDPSRKIVCDQLLDVAILGDHDALEQVLLILLDNAVKHGEGTITVAARIEPEEGQDSPGPGVAMQVRDGGPGIEPQVLPHVFERFYRGAQARGTRGLGLGLPIAKALVEAQDGTLTVESELGQGSVFTVVLPRAGPRPEALS